MKSRMISQAARLRRLVRYLTRYPAPTRQAPLTFEQRVSWDRWLLRRFRWYGALAPRRRLCPVCGWRGWAFLPFVGEAWTARNQRCPRCLAKPRHRALACYLEPLLAGSRRLRVLDVAGLRAFKAFCERRGAQYIHVQLGYAREMGSRGRPNAGALRRPDVRCDRVLSRAGAHTR